MSVKISQLRDESEEQLRFMVHELQKEIFELKNELAGSHKLEKPHLIKQKRREKARILTVLSEKQRKDK